MLFSKNLLVLRGNPSQGCLLFGEISDKVERIFLDYKKVPSDKQKFIIGFDRDEKLNHIITIVLKNGKMYSTNFKINRSSYDIQRIDNIPKKYVQKPKNVKLVKRIKNEAKLLNNARNRIAENTKLYISKIVRPVKGGRITGAFGSQRIINDIPESPHNGLDIAAPTGTTISAMANGLVRLIGDYFYNGKFVLLDHGSGLNSIYIHMSKICVSKWDYVVTGDKIGEIGSSGRSTGAHLHWGINKEDNRINPQLLLKNSDKVFLRIRK